MPVGAYSDVAVAPTCGLAGSEGLIGLMDDPASFYEPDRLAAQLVWFRAGFVEYRLPNRVPPGSSVFALAVSAEVCSEAPLHDPDGLAALLDELPRRLAPNTLLVTVDAHINDAAFAHALVTAWHEVAGAASNAALAATKERRCRVMAGGDSSVGPPL